LLFTHRKRAQYQKEKCLMKHYELLFVVKATLTAEEIAAQIATVKASIEKDGGEIVSTNDMGMRKLAYEVSKNNRGYYTVFYFKSNPANIMEIERLLRLNENILKFMTVKYEKKKEVAAWESLVKKNDNLAQAKTAPVAEEKTEAPAVETPAPEAEASEAPAAE